MATYSESEALRALRERLDNQYRANIGIAEDCSVFHRVALDALALAAKLEKERDAWKVQCEADERPNVIAVTEISREYEEALRLENAELQARLAQVEGERDEAQFAAKTARREAGQLIECAHDAVAERDALRAQLAEARMKRTEDVVAHESERAELESQLAAMGRVVEAAEKAIAPMVRNGEPMTYAEVALRDALAALRAGGS